MKTFVMTLSVLALSILGFSPFPASAESSIKLEKDAHAGSQSFPFTLPPLPYAYGALAPFIDARTMEIHYNRHHKGYVDNLNKAVEGNAEASGKTLTEILSGISAYDNAIRNNAGGHWNHSFFWSIMAPHSMESTIPTDLHNAIEAEFGSIDRFKQAFEQAGTARFGSGWVWLVVDENGKLGIISTPNQDNPLMADAPVRATPILGNDVWEHAYYLNYQNKRNEYLKNWWSVVNWEQVAKNYRAAK